MFYSSCFDLQAPPSSPANSVSPPDPTMQPPHHCSNSHIFTSQSFSTIWMCCKSCTALGIQYITIQTMCSAALLTYPTPSESSHSGSTIQHPVATSMWIMITTDPGSTEVALDAQALHTFKDTRFWRIPVSKMYLFLILLRISTDWCPTCGMVELMCANAISMRL